MKLKMVTLTGADDTVQPQQLFELSNYYPFVEWGILLSRNAAGGPRFPTQRWLAQLANLEMDNYGFEMHYAGHLCGAFVREILMGDLSLRNKIGGSWGIFDRVQINTHAQPHDFNAPNMVTALHREEKEFIFQHDGVNEAILPSVTGGLTCSTLFDLSHGAGVLPAEWPRPLPGVKCGYAGGLSPTNIREQLDRIAAQAGDAEVWVDMETHLRGSNGQTFDLGKCREVLEICKDFI